MTLRHYRGKGTRVIVDTIPAADHPVLEHADAVAERGAFRSAVDVLASWRDLLAAGRVIESQEQMVAVYLDARHRAIGAALLSRGSLASSTFHPRDTFRHAVGVNAAAFVLMHNHPSGDPSPSSDDLMVTERARRCGELLGITLLDHIIVGRGRYYSCSDEREHTAETTAGH